MCVKILDMDEKNLTRGLGLIKSNYDRSVQRGSRTQASVDAAIKLITGTTEYTDFKDCDMVVEAAFEEIASRRTFSSSLTKRVSLVRSCVPTHQHSISIRLLL